MEAFLQATEPLTKGISLDMPALENQKLIETSGGVSPIDGDATFRQLEAEYGSAWYQAISEDIWNSPLAKVK